MWVTQTCSHSVIWVKPSGKACRILCKPWFVINSKLNFAYTINLSGTSKKKRKRKKRLIDLQQRPKWSLPWIRKTGRPWSWQTPIMFYWSKKMSQILTNVRCWIKRSETGMNNSVWSWGAPVNFFLSQAEEGMSCHKSDPQIHYVSIWYRMILSVFPFLCVF